MGLAMLLAAVAFAPGGVASAKNGNPGIMPPNSKPYGHTYGEWSNRWYQWAFSMPVTHGNEQANPLFDTTGINCSRNQSGPVFFLAGIFSIFDGAAPKAVPVDRTECVVPAGKALFFPILNVEEDNAWNPSNDEAEIRAYLAQNVSQMENMTASIDGVAVGNLSDYLVGTDNPLTSVTFPADNLYDYYGVPVAPGTYSMMGTAGYYLMLHPLSVGQHVIRFAGSVGDFFSLDITYHLTVSPHAAQEQQ